MHRVGQIEMYENINKTELQLFELWKLRHSNIALFIEDLQNALGILINYKTGTIIKVEPQKNYFEETKLRLVLNNEIYTIDGLYYDDRQMMVRVYESQRLRKVSLRTIQEIQHQAATFDCREYK